MYSVVIVKISTLSLREIRVLDCTGWNAKNAMLQNLWPLLKKDTLLSGEEKEESEDN